MKILSVIQRYPPAIGGSETWCRELCRYLAARGHAVRVSTLDANNEEEFWHDPPDNNRTMVFGKFGFDEAVAVRRYHRSLPLKTLYYFQRLVFDKLLDVRPSGPHSAEMYAKMWREIQWADVVMLHTFPFPHNYIAMAYAKLFNKKTVIVPHFHPGHRDYEGWSNYWLLQKGDVVIADSLFEKNYLAGKGLPQKKIVHAGVGLNMKEYLPDNTDEYRLKLESKHGISPGDYIVTFIGRKIEDKGVGTLVDSVKKLYGTLPIKLFLAGPSSDWFNQLYSGLSMEEKTSIIDLGVISHQEKVNLLHASDLMAMPSKYEAFGIVFLEAWACGVPVLGSSEGAMPNIIGDAGFTIPFGDGDELSRVLNTVLPDRELLHRMGLNGKHMVEQKHQWSAIGETIEHCLMHGTN